MAMIGGAAAVAMGGFGSMIKWTVGQWATIQRERITAETTRATADREADERRSDRQIAATDRIGVIVNDHTTRDVAAQADVRAAVVRFESKLDTVIQMHERTPVGDERPASIESERRRNRSGPVPKPVPDHISRKHRT
jgi:hypothetical protein